MVPFLSGPLYAQDPLNQLKEETLSYFKPLKGKVVSLEGKTFSSDIGTKSGVRVGMRFAVLREGVPFLHPVTKQPVGKMETVAGAAMVKRADDDGSVMEIVKGDVREGDVLRISDTKIRVLFFQDRGIDWALADHYYRLLKESGRFELIDTPLDSGDDAAIVAEAKQKDSHLALLLRAEEGKDGVVLKQRMLWVEDSSKIFDAEVRADTAYMKELHLGENMLAPLSSVGDALLFFDLPFTGTLLASGDIDGDGSQELIITHGKYVRAYATGSSLQSLHEIKGDASDDYLWIDALDIDGDGKDEILLTSMKDGDVVSYIYGLRDAQFSPVWKGNLFLKRLNNGLIAQEHEKGEGFRGPVFAVTFEKGEFRRGDALKLPKGINIYDFTPLDGLDGMKYILAYDDAGFLNLYNIGGLRVWSSREDMGGFRTVFKKNAPTVMADRGVWTVKDRLLMRNKEALAVKRVPLANMAKGLGYKRSQIKSLIWTGAMEERTLIDDISGSILDYAVAGDRLIVMSKPLFGIKAKNILKGENPMGSMLYIYSLRGK